MTTRYINTDLEVVSEEDLESLTKLLQPNSDVLHSEKLSDGLWHLSVEAEGSGLIGSADHDPNRDIEKLLTLIEGLDEGHRAILTRAKTFEFDVGLEHSGSRPERVLSLPSRTLARIQAVSATLGETVYPLENRWTKPRARPEWNVAVREARPEDADAWLALRRALWPQGLEAEHRREIEQFFGGELPRDPWAVLLAEDERGRLVGLAELSLRAHAEGCRSSPVAYLEGWFVAQEARGRGAGRALVAAAESLGRSQGCSEFASDTSADNHAAAAAHRSVGFQDAGPVRCFRKNL